METGKDLTQVAHLSADFKLYTHTLHVSHREPDRFKTFIAHFTSSSLARLVYSKRKIQILKVESGVKASPLTPASSRLTHQIVSLCRYRDYQKMLTIAK